MVADNPKDFCAGSFHDFNRFFYLMPGSGSRFDDQYDARHDTGHHDGIDHEAIGREQGATVDDRQVMGIIRLLNEAVDRLIDAVGAIGVGRIIGWRGQDVEGVVLDLLGKILQVALDQLAHRAIEIEIEKPVQRGSKPVGIEDGYTGIRAVGRADGQGGGDQALALLLLGAGDQNTCRHPVFHTMARRGKDAFYLC